MKKSRLSVFVAAAVLSGCMQNPLVKGDNTAASPAAEAPKAAAPAPQAQPDAQQLQSSAAALPPCVDPAPEQATAHNKKSKKKSKHAAQADMPVQPCSAAAPASKPAVPAPAPAAPVPAPAAPVQAAAVATDGAKREVKGINDWSGYIQGIPAPHSKFPALKIGMGQKEVTDILGQPTDQATHATGKAFIPFYMGSGKIETWMYYKGMGRLLFASGAGITADTSLIGIENDANERGYK